MQGTEAQRGERTPLESVGRSCSLSKEKREGRWHRWTLHEESTTSLAGALEADGKHSARLRDGRNRVNEQMPKRGRGKNEEKSEASSK